tara:strand:- start:425 stop:622 length:198 start_codon:yes stop_codon:yes gene_type:complete
MRLGAELLSGSDPQLPPLTARGKKNDNNMLTGGLKPESGLVAILQQRFALIAVISSASLTLQRTW